MMTLTITVPWLPTRYQDDTSKPGCEIATISFETFADDCMFQPLITLVWPAACTMGVSEELATPTASAVASANDESTPIIVKFNGCRYWQND